MPVCGNCGEDNPGRARFCLACGQALEGDTEASRETRKTVTVLFTDLAGSTAMGERLDPETLRRVMDRYFERMRVVIEAHGGTVEKYIGDAIMAVFGIPTLHEDDALRAVRATAGMREALAALNDELERDRGVRLAVRTGVNTGEVVTGDTSGGQRLVTGDAVNVAARLEQAARANDVLLGEATYRLVRDAVEVEPIEAVAAKGKTKPLVAYRLVSVAVHGEGVSRRLDSRMVGREHERMLLSQALDRAVQERRCNLFTVLGAAGVGKSRLVAEFATGGRPATVLEGRCLPYGEGITYWPVREIIASAAGATPEDALEAVRSKLAAVLGEDGTSLIDQVAGLVGLAEHSVSAEEGHRAVRRVLEILSRRRPLVVVFDDIHWAEPAMLDLIEHVADWSRDAPMLLLCVARAELLELRPGWGGGKMNATSILLQPLSAVECRDLIDNLLGGTGLDDATVARIVEAAEGNPLFVEQMIAALVDDGVLVREEDGWRVAGDLAEVPVPTSIQALLSARLDRLGDAEREVIERASVVGRVFYQTAVAELSPERERPAVGSHLLTLVRKELIRPAPAEFADEDTFRFLHMLIRDAAYESMPKEMRADLHERFATWLAGVAGDREREFEEILGYHLEQAHRFRAEIGPQDEALRGLALRTADRLLPSADRALERDDPVAASAFLERALRLLPENDPRRTDALLHLVRARYQAGLLAEAADAVREGLEAARARSDRAAMALFSLRQVEVDLSQGTTGFQDALDRAASLATDLEALGHAGGVANARAVIAQIQFWLGRAGESRTSLEAARALVQALGDRTLELSILRGLTGVALFGPAPREDALADLNQMLEDVQGTGLAAFVHGARAALHAMAGRRDAALADLDRFRRLAADFGQRLNLAAAHSIAETYLILGEPEGAVEPLEEGLALLETMGERGYASTTAAYLADIYLALERNEDAKRAVALAEDLTVEDDLAAVVQSRSARATILSRSGDDEAAVSMIRSALEVADRVDYHTLAGNALMSAGEIFARAGLLDQTRNSVARAIERYELRGNDVQAERARAALARFSSPS